MAKLSERDLEERFEQFLDAVYPIVPIGPYEYETSMALKRVDPIAYTEGFNNWLDSESGETIWEVDGEYFDEEPEDTNA